MVHFRWSTQKHQAQYKVGVRWGTLGPVGHKESASLGWEEVPQEQLKSTESYFKSNLIQPTEDNLCLHCPSRAACLMLKWLYGLFWHVLVIFIDPILCSKTFKAQSSSILILHVLLHFWAKSVSWWIVSLHTQVRTMLQVLPAPDGGLIFSTLYHLPGCAIPSLRNAKTQHVGKTIEHDYIYTGNSLAC